MGGNINYQAPLPLPTACEKSLSCQSLDNANSNPRIRPRAVSSRSGRKPLYKPEPLDFSKVFFSESPLKNEIKENISSSRSVQELPKENISSSRSVQELPSEFPSRENSSEKKQLPEVSPSDSSISTLVSTLRSLLHEVQDTNRSSESYKVCDTILEQLEQSHTAEVSSLSNQIEKWQKLYVDELVSNHSMAKKAPTSISGELQKSNV